MRRSSAAVVGGKVVPNTGYETKTYTPPLVAPEKVTTVDNILQRRPGESLYSGRTPAERAVLKMADDFKELREHDFTPRRVNVRTDHFYWHNPYHWRRSK